MTLAAGTRLGRYEILSPLGAGGMGEVYRARDTRLGREVAVKVLPAAFSKDPDRLRRFEREARAASALDHPNILTVHDVGEEEGSPYVVSELLVGETLRERLATGALSTRRAVEGAAQIAAGLAAAHEKGIVHRDLKPENVFITRDGRFKILDFGLAKAAPAAVSGASGTETATVTATEPGVTMGTVGYMAPEQVRGEPADARSDIFSFGAVLYEMLAGQRAFRGGTAVETLHAILREEPEPLGGREAIAPALDRVVRRCLEKEPAARFQTASDLGFALGEASDIRPPSTRDLPLHRRRRFRFWSALAGSLVLLAGVVIIANVGGLAERFRKRGAVDRIRSLVVLPLDNYSKDPDQDYFADGMTEELITNLAQIGSLRVISRTSAMRYKGTRKSVPEIARELGVEGVLEGSVQRAGDRVRVTAQLIDASTDQHLWARSYERELKDVLSLEGELAQAIAAEIGVTVGPEQRTRLSRNKSVDPEAYEAYLKGRYYLFRKTPADTQKSLEYFLKAAARQPDYALAYVGAADTYSQMAGSAYDVVPPMEAYPKAKAAARRALEIDPTIGEAHVTLGWASFVFDRDAPVAERELRRAIELNPGYPDAHQTYAVYLARRGRFDEGVAEMKRAQELDPLSLYYMTSVGLALHWAERDADAIPWFRRVLEMDPNFLRAHWGLGRSLTRLRRYAEGIPELQEAAALSGDGPAFVGSLGYAYAVSGRTAEARRIAETLAERSRQTYVPPATVAVVFAGLGDRDAAFEWLEKAWDQHDPWITALKVEFMLDPLHSDPRFAALVKRVGLD